ncbi:MAG: type III pantothenate kinase [Gammaproteobacteria bacterium]|nr:MAG: type III pantothenate kinase [Gammaproteobacteria bacterium]
MNLLMDVGNTRIKAAITQVDGLHELKPFAYDLSNCESLLSHQIDGLEVPQKVLVANVGGEAVADRITACMARLWRREPKFVQVPREWGGLVNGYADIRQLGVDRWLGLLAAWMRYRQLVCVVSCGTAVTIDCATGDGRHLGGVIIPGLELMQRSLNQATKGINATRTSDPSCKLGLSTDVCVANGALYAVCSLIKNVLADLESRHGEQPSLVVTGGDAATVGECLSTPFASRPALVLEGLAIIAEQE